MSDPARRDTRLVSKPSATKDLALSYGPIALVTIFFLLMTALVPPVDRDLRTLEPTVVTETDPGAPGDPTQAAPSAPGQTTTTDPAAPGQPPAPGEPGYWVPPGGQACTDRTQQVPGDTYSPPCYGLDGDNGGATSRGVTADEVVVSVREVEDFDLPSLFAELSGQEVADDAETIRTTLRTLAEYFNRRFQLWGRQIRLEFFGGQGAVFNEFLGGGIAGARADAIRASQEVGSFADISAITIPYADQLSRQDVVNIGSPYPSREWYDRRRPFAWSVFTNGTAVVESAAAATLARLKDRPAEFAGEGLRGRPRTFAVVAPENAEYQESVNAYIRRLAEGGVDVQINLRYKIDVNSMPTQASDIIAQLKDRGITTVQCGCDPIMLAIGLAPKANEANYFPEWSSAGLAFVDQDIISQLIDSRQWQRAFGIAYNAASEPFGASIGYRAYKSVRPNDEPAFGVEAFYAQMYLLALGLHMAGPNLTPQTFEQGLFNYPGGTGPYGSWGFGPGNHTTTDDYREVWWDPNRLSPQNGQPGAWVELHGGRRYHGEEAPTGEPNFFR